MCTGSHGHVHPVVDEDTRSGTANSLDRPGDQGEQSPVRHVTLANLNQVDAGSRRCGDAPDEGRLGMPHRDAGDP